jgi:acetyl esterase/lipase
MKYPILAILFLAFTVAGHAQKVFPIWPGLPPGSVDTKGQEGQDTSEWGGNDPLIYNVTQPVLTFFPADPSIANGTSVIICPGGAFCYLHTKTEGSDVAEYLNKKGVSAFVLKYRLVHSETSHPVKERYARAKDAAGATKLFAQIVPLAIADGRQALVYVRQHAAEFHIDPDKTGIIGFSAGGTLACADAFNYTPDNRPAFVAPIYAYIPPSLPIIVQKDAPPLFVAAATDDEAHLVPTTIDLYNKWLNAGHSAEIHVYAKGGHGFGMNPQNLPTDTWIDRFGDWLQQQGFLSSPPKTAAAPGRLTDNVIVITLDGLRWQELFTGADSVLINNPEYTRNIQRAKDKYWAPSPEERRRKLFPFFWSTVDSLGQIHGNRNAGSKVNIMNEYRYSYPGYNEMFTGFPHDTTGKANNGENPNKNTSVLEFVNQLPAYKGRVAAFTSWYAFRAIFNDKRSGIFVNAGYDSIHFKTPAFQLLNDMQWHVRDEGMASNERSDMFTFYLAKEYIREFKPKVLHIGLVETDNFGHEGNYSNTLNSANMADAWIADLWKMLQSMPEYKDKTTLLLLADHGRGDKIKAQWKDHDSNIEGAQDIWFAAMGPGIRRLGEVRQPEQLYQAQLAQTIARLLGLTFTAEHPIEPAINGL